MAPVISTGGVVSVLLSLSAFYSPWSPHLESEIPVEICVACYFDNESIHYNLNGRCDECGGTNFELREVLDQELENDE